MIMMICISAQVCINYLSIHLVLICDSYVILVLGLYGDSDEIIVVKFEY